MKDARYTVSLEFTGHIHPQYVLRFCGDWLGAFDCADEANRARITAIVIRQCALRAGW